MPIQEELVPFEIDAWMNSLFGTGVRDRILLIEQEISIRKVPVGETNETACSAFIPPKWNFKNFLVNDTVMAPTC